LLAHLLLKSFLEARGLPAVGPEANALPDGLLQLHLLQGLERLSLGIESTPPIDLVGELLVELTDTR